MASCYESQLSQPVQKQSDAHTRVAMMAEAETTSKINQRTNLYLRLARLRYQVLPEQIHCSHERNLDKEQLLLLSELSFIDNGENILVTGATGCGKSYLACALGARPVCCGLKFFTIP